MKLSKKQMLVFGAVLSLAGAVGISIITEWISCNLKQNGYLCSSDCNDKE